jgi:hypothetical protein
MERSVEELGRSLGFLRFMEPQGARLARHRRENPDPERKPGA